MRRTGTRFLYDDVVVKKPNKLPHWYTPLGVYFVTYRLTDSLPRHIEQAIEEECLAMQEDFHRAKGTLDDDDQLSIRRHLFKRVQSQLDHGFGTQHLARDPIASIAPRRCPSLTVSDTNCSAGV